MDYNHIPKPEDMRRDNNLPARRMINHNMSDLSELMTDEKCCLVGAINEVVSNLDEFMNDVATADLVGKEGPAGKDGIDGKDGEQGIQGIPGVDGKPGLDGAPGRDGKDGLTGPQGLQGIQGVQGVAGKDGLNGATGATGPKGDTGDSRIKYAQKGLTTNSSGVWTGTMPATGLVLTITPTTEGAMLSSLVESGTTLTITFKKLNTGALNLNINNLLSASILAATPGVITFNLTGTTPV